MGTKWNREHPDEARRIGREAARRRYADPELRKRHVEAARRYRARQRRIRGAVETFALEVLAVYDRAPYSSELYRELQFSVSRMRTKLAAIDMERLIDGKAQDTGGNRSPAGTSATMAPPTDRGKTRRVPRKEQAIPAEARTEQPELGQGLELPELPETQVATAGGTESCRTAADPSPTGRARP